MKKFVTMSSALFDAYYDKKSRSFEQYCLDEYGVDVNLLPYEMNAAAAIFAQVVNNENEFVLDEFKIPHNTAFALSSTKEERNAVFYDDQANHVFFRGMWVINPKVNTMDDIDPNELVYTKQREVLSESEIRSIRIKKGLRESGYKATGKKADLKKHHRIIELSKSGGLTKSEIAKAVGVGVATVYRVLRLNNE